MKHAVRVVAVVALLALAGCSPPPPPDAADVVGYYVATVDSRSLALTLDQEGHATFELPTPPDDVSDYLSGSEEIEFTSGEGSWKVGVEGSVLIYVEEELVARLYVDTGVGDISLVRFLCDPDQLACNAVYEKQ